MKMINFFMGVPECAINFLKHSKIKNLEQTKRLKVKSA